jgi:xanthosine utilization system XapX-like protein
VLQSAGIDGSLTVAETVGLGVGVVFLHAHLAAAAVPGLALTILVGMLVAFAVGVACSTIVPPTDAALPVATTWVDK